MFIHTLFLILINQSLNSASVSLFFPLIPPSPPHRYFSYPTDMHCNNMLQFNPN